MAPGSTLCWPVTTVEMTVTLPETGNADQRNVFLFRRHYAHAITGIVTWFIVNSNARINQKGSDQ